MCLHFLPESYVQMLQVPCGYHLVTEYKVKTFYPHTTTVPEFQWGYLEKKGVFTFSSQ